MEYLFGSPDGRFGAKISANYKYSRSIPSWKECKKFLFVLQQGNALSVEQTRGQRQTGRNDLPGKGERVAGGW